VEGFQLGRARVAWKPQLDNVCCHSNLTLPIDLRLASWSQLVGSVTGANNIAENSSGAQGPTGRAGGSSRSPIWPLHFGSRQLKLMHSPPASWVFIAPASLGDHMQPPAKLSTATTTRPCCSPRAELQFGFSTRAQNERPTPPTSNSAPKAQPPIRAA